MESSNPVRDNPVRNSVSKRDADYAFQAGRISNGITPLCKIAYKYGADKCPQLKHAYTPFYYKLLNGKRKSIKKVLELGIGYYKNMQHVEVVYDPGLKRYYHRGASLKMWRDFFPNAQIYGADIRPQTLFEDERIKTYLCDERKREDLVKLIENTGSDIDLFIDDGDHHLHHQIFTCQTLMPLLKKDVIYIIEDVTHSKKLVKALSNYDCWTPQISILGGNDQVVVVRSK